MKHKFLTLALMAAVGSSMLFSCQNAEEPVPVAAIEPDGEMVEYSISVNVPDEMRTRDAATASIGLSGLYEFPERTIDKLWYVAYYDNKALTSGSVERADENPFSVKASIKENDDPTKLYFFLWAGNKDDKVGIDQESSDNIINIYTNGAVDFTNNLFQDLNVYDCFGGYYAFTETSEVTTRQKTITLKRPFAEIHVISDDFTDGELQKDYTNGYNTIAGLSKTLISDYSKWSSSPMCAYNIWDFKTNSFRANTSSRVVAKLSNDFSDTELKRVTFKDREMDYYTIFYTFPSDAKYLTFAVNNGSETLSTKSKFVNVELPEDGIKANTKYIIYNKSRDEGGTGFLEGYLKYEILANHDGTWENPSKEKESDRAL